MFLTVPGPDCHLAGDATRAAQGAPHRRETRSGIDGANPVDLDELDLIPIDQRPSYIWYQDMVDFAEGISDHAAGRRLGRSLNGKGAFRRFGNELYDRHPELISAWQSLRDARASARAIRWLVEQGLLEERAAEQFTDDHPEPVLP